MSNNKCLPWDVVEKTIYKEILWLKNVIDVSPYVKNEQITPLGCSDTIYRRIAILIVSGKIKVKEIRSKNLWGDKIINLELNTTKSHGKEWHNNMMKIIAKYFKDQNYNVENEPRLNYGNADLLVYKKKRYLY